ncbi:sulfatase [Actinoplanes bogorensis]|uniref:Sulfatase n=1 Tax=Paractinoplanes bogorensis TaxID=1610840 RepID=A0ABS5YGW8_9ACTN|nr:sulfatase-like hydrolase/transferase [Actinoplanes bogorensis]MBU2662705.1 sulfatase [Actinoplanes bogorensis]
MKHVRRVGGAVLTLAAAVLVFLALVTPDQITRLAPGNFWGTALVRVPIEGLLAVALLLALPARARRITATVLGVLLGVLSVLKIIDIGFFAVLARAFDPVLDWTLFKDGFNFLTDSIGTAGAIGVAAGAVLLAVVVLGAMIFSVRRLSRLLPAAPNLVRGGVVTLSVAWIVLAVMGFQLVGGIPVASQTATDLARDTVLAVPQDIQDRKDFAREVQDDDFKNLPTDQLLSALRGKDVIVGFVESYGRDAVENPAFNQPVVEQLRAGQQKLAAKGFTGKSGYLTSPTFGGGSWLAHSTFLSGLWIDNQNRYRSLVATDRLTLTSAFKKAGFRTTGFEPGVTFAWPEGQFYGYEQIYDAHTLGYHGPMLSWSTMPDQYVMKKVHDYELGQDKRRPTLAEVTLTSSHTPWTPVPSMLPWDKIGDGSVYNSQIAGAESPQKLFSEGDKVKQAYAGSIAYSLDSLMSYVQEYGDDNLVLVLLGDHQPASIVVGGNATKDVPISIVAKDKKVLDRISAWGWTDGLTPAPDAPLWPMNEFRDKFLTAYSPQGEPH